MVIPARCHRTSKSTLTLEKDMFFLWLVGRWRFAFGIELYDCRALTDSLLPVRGCLIYGMLKWLHPSCSSMRKVNFNTKARAACSAVFGQPFPPPRRDNKTPPPPPSPPPHTRHTPRPSSVPNANVWCTLRLRCFAADNQGCPAVCCGHIYYM